MNKPNQMFLIQRKSDGKYYREGGWNSDPEFYWTKRKSEGKLFKSTSGAKNSRGWTDSKWIRSLVPCSECDKAIRSNPRNDHYYHWKWSKMAEGELPKRIIPVSVSIT